MRLFAVLTMTLSMSVFATQTPQEKGREIAQKVSARNEGFVGEQSRMKMILISADGQEVVREMEGKIQERADDGDRSLMEFENPKDVKGTKMLTWSHKQGDDDQWLYLPSLRRVKRISSSGKSASFMGSEFTFEDLGGQEIEKYNYKWLRDETIGGDKVWVLERTSKEPSGYSKQIMYMSQSLYNPLKVEYYNRRGELLKVAEFSDFKTYTVGGKKLSRANKVHMKNVQTKKESLFTWQDRSLGKKFPDAEFSQGRLK